MVFMLLSPSPVVLTTWSNFVTTGWLLPDLGALDLSPMVVLLAVIILQGPVRENLFGALMRATI